MKAETERLATRIRPEDKRLIAKAASLSGVSISVFVKKQLREAALKVIDQEQVIKLNTEDSLRFTEALLAPPKNITPEFKEAMRLHDQMVEER